MVAPSMTVAPRVAYLIDSTSGPAEPTRLAATLRAGNADAVIAVAHDERVAGPLDSRRVRELGLEPLPGPLGDSPAQLLGLAAVVAAAAGVARGLTGRCCWPPTSTRSGR